MQSGFTIEDISIFLEQIEWQRYREGTYSNQDPLVAIKAKLRTMRTAIKNGDGPNGDLDSDDLKLLLKATLGSINHIDSYDYKLEPEESARLRAKTLSPLLAIAKKLRLELGEEKTLLPTIVKGNDVLSDTEAEELRRYESIIERGLAEFIEVGNALVAIRDKRLYRVAHKTFDGYCRQRWGLSRVHAHRMIGAAKVIHNLLPIGNKLQTVSTENNFRLPTCESQVRPLTGLDPGQQREVWQKAVETAPEGKITAIHVQRIVNQGRVVPHVSYNTGDNEWYTPQEFIDAARDVMGDIDLDPASTPEANEVVGAKTFYTKEDDGLSKDWRGKVWMNPPYASELIGKFTNKMVGHIKSGYVTDAIVLVNNATETSWFCNLVSVASAICFPSGRIKFWAPNKKTASPLQGQAIIYIGNKPDRFMSRFREFGWTARISRES